MSDWLRVGIMSPRSPMAAATGWSGSWVGQPRTWMGRVGIGTVSRSQAKFSLGAGSMGLLPAAVLGWRGVDRAADRRLRAAPTSRNVDGKNHVYMPIGGADKGRTTGCCASGKWLKLSDEAEMSPISWGNGVWHRIFVPFDL